VYNFRTGSSGVFLTDHLKASSCRLKSFDPELKKLPLTYENMDCEFVKLDAFDYLKENFMFEDLTYSDDLQDLEIVINRFAGFDINSSIFGYLSIDFSHKTTSFENLDDIGSPDLLFLNQTYYLLRQEQ
jgi:hypothetical protein